MDKLWYQSKTVWGAILFSISSALEQLGTTHPILMIIGKGLGSLITIYGFRDALD